MKKINDSPCCGIKAMAKAKSARRKMLAGLSFEEKIRILVTMQSIAAGIKRSPGKRCRRVWEI